MALHVVSLLLLSEAGPAPVPTFSVGRELSDPGSGFASSLADVTKLLVLTKPSRPMAFIADDGNGDASGYTIQLLKDSLAPALGIGTVEVQMLADNNEIMSSAG